MIIREKDKKRIREMIKDCISEPVEVWAYGSRVDGTGHEASDLDLVIRTTDLQPLNAGQIATLQENLRESNVPLVVEIRDWAKIPDSFHNQIEKQHEVFYSGKEEVTDS